METCPEHGKSFKNGRGLATHIGMKHKVGTGGKPLPPEQPPIPSIPREDLDLTGDEFIAKHGAKRAGEMFGKGVGDLVQGIRRGLKDAGIDVV